MLSEPQRLREKAREARLKERRKASRSTKSKSSKKKPKMSHPRQVELEATRGSSEPSVDSEITVDPPRKRQRMSVDAKLSQGVLCL